jgi:peptide/nickel transport system substrate-binding protein
MTMNKFNRNFRALSAGAAISILMMAAPAAFAETPKDTLVEGFAIDDIITMDPGEAFELSTAEVTSNTYSLLVRLDMTDTSKVKGDLADSWTVSDDGLTYTFKLKSGMKFASGNPITAEDVAWSFERAVKLDKSPAFIITQFGITGDNVTEKAKATRRKHLHLHGRQALCTELRAELPDGNGCLRRRQEAGSRPRQAGDAICRLQVRQ